MRCHLNLIYFAHEPVSMTLAKQIDTGFQVFTISFKFRIKPCEKQNAQKYENHEPGKSHFCLDF